MKPRIEKKGKEVRLHLGFISPQTAAAFQQDPTAGTICLFIDLVSQICKDEEHTDAAFDAMLAVKEEADTGDESSENMRQAYVDLFECFVKILKGEVETIEDGSEVLQ